MTDIQALDKYPCSACGAQAEWNPSKQLLVCPFCGTAAPFTVNAQSGALVENDLAKALNELPDEARGWLAEKRTVQCQSCKAVSVFDPERVGQNCGFCGSPSLVDYTEIQAPIRPDHHSLTFEQTPQETTMMIELAFAIGLALLTTAQQPATGQASSSTATKKSLTTKATVITS